MHDSDALMTEQMTNGVFLMGFEYASSKVTEPLASECQGDDVFWWKRS